MEPAGFEEANLTLGPPEGKTEDQVGSLRVYSDGEHIISRWKPTGDELKALVNGGSLWLWVGGKAMPPVSLTTDHPFEQS